MTIDAKTATRANEVRSALSEVFPTEFNLDDLGAILGCERALALTLLDPDQAKKVEDHTAALGETMHGKDFGTNIMAIAGALSVIIDQSPAHMRKTLILAVARILFSISGK